MKSAGGDAFHRCARSLRVDQPSSLFVFHRRRPPASAGGTRRCAQASAWLLFGARSKKMCSTHRKRGCWKAFVSGRQGRRRRCPSSALWVRVPGGWVANPGRFLAALVREFGLECWILGWPEGPGVCRSPPSTDVRLIFRPLASNPSLEVSSKPF